MAEAGRSTVERLEGAVPWIEWREPLVVASTDAEGPVTRYACRVCVALYGLASDDVRALRRDEDAHREHFMHYHLRVP